MNIQSSAYSSVAEKKENDASMKDLERLTQFYLWKVGSSTS